MANIYPGQNLKLQCTFKVGTSPTDPDGSITLKVMKPDGTTTSYTYGSAELTRASVGVYYRVVLFSVEGGWRYRWEGVGSNITAATEGTIEITRSPFV